MYQIVNIAIMNGGDRNEKSGSGFILSIKN